MNVIITLEKSKNNKDTLLINSKYIHSKFNPEADAYNVIFEGKNIIAIFGAGLCYHINNLYKNNPQSIFIIYEPLQEIFNKIDQYLLKDIKKEKILLLNNLDFKVIYNFISKNSILGGNRIKYYSNQGYKNLFPKLELKFFETIKNCYELFIQNTLTECSFYSLWSKNFIKNFFLFSQKPLLNIKKLDLLSNNLAVITCAGPNLINDIEYLKNYREKITIFSVDTALKPLVKNGINPDFIISLDGQHHSIYDLPSNYKDSIILFDITAYPYLCRKYENSYFVINHNFLESGIGDYFLKNNGIKVSTIPIGGTVADYAFKLAINIGFKNILFCGLDLSYPDFLTHCKESPYYEKILIESTYFNSPETVMIQNISKRNIKFYRSKLGGNVLSDFVLLNYRENFNFSLEYDKETKVFNSLNNGVLIENFKDIDILDFLKKLDSFRIDAKEIILRLEKITLKKENIIDFYNKIEKDLYDSSLILKEILENTNFSNNTPDSLYNIKFKIDGILGKYNFLSKFIIMTDIILNRKGMRDGNILYYKHICHTLLQSIYFLIRNLQKSKIE